MFPGASRTVLAVAGFLTLVASPARADVLSTFTANAEGWSAVNFTDFQFNNYAVFSTSPATHSATGGNPGGFIAAADPDNGELTFSAPAAFLGNVAGATGLSYDLTYTGTVNRQTTDVLLTGNGTRLLWKSNPDVVPGAGWTTVNVPFTPSPSWRVGTTTGPLATAADFQNVLGNLTGLFLRGEYTNGVTETAGLDNVRLIGVGAAVPEPGTFALLGAGALLLAARRRSARRR